MDIKFYLIIKSSGSVRTTKNKPDLNYDEISMAMNVNVPNQLFKKPSLTASITIPDEAATPPTIEASVLDNVKEAIQAASGMEVKLTFDQGD